MTGDFVVNHTRRRGSGVPIDQALEKAYNKPAKGPGGVIGYTRKKESVAKWNLIKHEKLKYSMFIDDLCSCTDQGQYSLHHEFSKSITKSEEENVRVINEYLCSTGDIFEGNFANIVTGEEFDEKTTEFYLGCCERGERLYREFRKTQLLEKTKLLFDTIPKPKIMKTKSQELSKSVIDVEKETTNFLRTKVSHMQDAMIFKSCYRTK